ncbi:MAG: tRNA lysidine(34) synthetase TilS [Saprospiraceae bacterium]
MDLLEGFFKFLKTQCLLPEAAAPTLLAGSGGLDSVVMAHLFREANLPFGIAHCNFQLRGAESEGDELFVQKLARDLGAPFFSKRFDTRAYAERNGLSTQMAARELRYEWFGEIASENGFGQIATAHHLNDSVETALLNFVRGTGLAGLSGIAPKTDLIVHRSSFIVPLLRPLLFAARAEIEAYARAHKLAWREDSSNASDDYARNFVRHHIVPGLEELNPNFLRTAERNMARIGEEGHNLDFLLKKWLDIDGVSLSVIDGVTQSHPVNNLGIEKQKLAQLPAPQQALRQLLKPYGFDAEQTRQLAENLDHIGLELKSEKGWQLLNDRSEILLRPLAGLRLLNFESLVNVSVSQDDLMVSLPDGSRLFLIESDNQESIISNQQSIMVNGDKLQFPLHLRHWHPGDSFQPFGMGGKSQKLQDFFTNQKFSRFEKDEVWLLVNGDGAVVWVVGHRLDERFKIYMDTKKALKFNWIK